MPRSWNARYGGTENNHKVNVSLAHTHAHTSKSSSVNGTEPRELPSPTRSQATPSTQHLGDAGDVINLGAGAAPGGDPGPPSPAALRVTPEAGRGRQQHRQSPDLRPVPQSRRPEEGTGPARSLTWRGVSGSVS